MRFWKAAALLTGTLTLAEAGGTAYFYRRTMIRNNADMKRTMKMAGTDWNQYMDIIQDRKEKLLANPYQDLYQISLLLFMLLHNGNLPENISLADISPFTPADNIFQKIFF